MSAAPAVTAEEAERFARLVRRRRMTRAYSDEPVNDETLTRILELARRAPSAGNTAALDFLVLSGAEQTRRYWETTLRSSADFAWPELPKAAALVMLWVRPQAYADRYSEPDKAQTGLGSGIDVWSVPYWFVDGGAAAMTILLAAESEGLGALLFAMFDHEPEVKAAFGVPEDRRSVGVVALGHGVQHRLSRSALRPRPDLAAIMHRGHW